MNWQNCIFNNDVLTISCIGPLITFAINLALGLAGTVALFLLIVAGIRFIASGGGKEVDEAKKMFTYALIGLIVVLLAYFIINLVAGITGVPCIMNNQC